MTSARRRVGWLAPVSLLLHGWLPVVLQASVMAGKADGRHSSDAPICSAAVASAATAADPGAAVSGHRRSDLSLRDVREPAGPRSRPNAGRARRGQGHPMPPADAPSGPFAPHPAVRSPRPARRPRLIRPIDVRCGAGRDGCVLTVQSETGDVSQTHRRRAWRRPRDCPHLAAAHVTLESQKAFANSSYKAVLRVPHGCEGKPTTAIRVRIPEGLIVVEPMPKPGWQLAVVKGRYQRPYRSEGGEVTEGVKEIDWSGGKLPDDFYDEFVFVGRLSDFSPGTVLSFPTVQECEGGAVQRWIEIPAPGQNPDDLEDPAPQLTVIEGKGGDDD